MLAPVALKLPHLVPPAVPVVDVHQDIAVNTADGRGKEPCKRELPEGHTEKGPPLLRASREGARTD
jgi:hypothetical protein